MIKNYYSSTCKFHLHSSLSLSLSFNAPLSSLFWSLKIDYGKDEEMSGKPYSAFWASNEILICNGNLENVFEM